MPTVQLHCEERSQFLTPLPMGWALKTVTKKARFTPKQNEWVVLIYQQANWLILPH